MILRTLKLSAWRNLAPCAVTPSPGVTVFQGDNGQGKTNFLEAAYFLSEFRSFRTSTSADLIQWGAETARLDATVTIGGLDRQVEVHMGAGQKATKVDGKLARRDATILRGLAVVLFVPEDLLLPRATPASRRAFVDRTIFNVDRTYYREAVAYQKALRSRNVLLRQGLPAGPLLEAYDEELAKWGARTIVRRRRVVAALQPRVAALFEGIHGPQGAAIGYRGHPSVAEAEGEDQVREALHRGLIQRHELDQRRRFTGFGPHTDDVDVLLQERPAREHGSQGQVRSLVLAMKLAELAYIEEALGESPMLLLDDVASELDQDRRRKLFETIAGLSGQTFITTTDLSLLPSLARQVDFSVLSGCVKLSGAAGP